IYLGGSFSASGYNVIKSSITIDIDEVNDLIESSTFYPNPMTNSGTLNVKLKKHASAAHLSIIDAQGTVVVENEITEMNNNEINFTVNRSDMAAGMYYYRLDVDGNAVSSHPFVIE
ncbi:MAG: T9SS type A sorting domain-containing protein, partial [Bacteroidia bacterium]|nr:T9SS type A sorting domain-containing protein [Bacteroidia bacterium]